MIILLLYSFKGVLQVPIKFSEDDDEDIYKNGYLVENDEKSTQLFYSYQMVDCVPLISLALAFAVTNLNLIIIDINGKLNHLNNFISPIDEQVQIILPCDFLKHKPG